jgi:hypothetical protein
MYQLTSSPILTVSTAPHGGVVARKFDGAVRAPPALLFPVRTCSALCHPLRGSPRIQSRRPPLAPFPPAAACSATILVASRSPPQAAERKSRRLFPPHYETWTHLEWIVSLCHVVVKPDIIASASSGFATSHLSHRVETQLSLSTKSLPPPLLTPSPGV